MSHSLINIHAHDKNEGMYKSCTGCHHKNIIKKKTKFRLSEIYFLNCCRLLQGIELLTFVFIQALIAINRHFCPINKL